MEPNKTNAVNWNVAAHTFRSLSDMDLKNLQSLIEGRPVSDYRRSRLWNEGLLRVDRQSLTMIGRAVVRLSHEEDPWQVTGDIIGGRREGLDD